MASFSISSILGDRTNRKDSRVVPYDRPWKQVTVGLAVSQSAALSSRFAVPLTSRELENACSKFTCANTRKNNTWATKFLMNGGITEIKQQQKSQIFYAHFIPGLPSIMLFLHLFLNQDAKMEKPTLLTP